MEHKPLGTTNTGTLLDRIDVGRVMSWYEYEARAKQEGGRLPTAAELEHDGISLSYDQWTPVIPSAVDSQTGRDDGLTADDVSNAWANIGPRKYVIEFPSWGLDASESEWKSLHYFYVRRLSSVLTDSEGVSPVFTNWNLQYQQPRNDYVTEEMFAIMHASGAGLPFCQAVRAPAHVFSCAMQMLGSTTARGSMRPMVTLRMLCATDGLRHRRLPRRRPHCRRTARYTMRAGAQAAPIQMRGGRMARRSLRWASAGSAARRTMAPPSCRSTSGLWASRPFLAGAIAGAKTLASR